MYYPHPIGGAELAVKEITERMSSYDIEFDMITLKNGKPNYEKVGNIHVHRVGLPRFGFLANTLSYSRLMKYMYIFEAYSLAKKLKVTRKYDATWAIMANYAGFAALFFKMSRPEIPFLLTLQEGDPIEHIKERLGMFYKLWRKIFQRADYIQTISNFLARFAQDNGATCPISVIGNGVSFNKFSERVDESVIREIRRGCGFSDEDTIIVTTSRLVRKNATEMSIRALSLLDKKYKFLIIGTGEDEYMLRSLADELDVANRVVFKGFINHDSLPQYLQASDIFLRPSRSEGLGNSFLEAMAAGIPVIATKVGGIEDFMVDNETGLVCEVDDPKSIADKVMLIEKNPELADRIVIEAREMVKDKYEWNNITQKMKQIFFGLTQKDDPDTVDIDKI